MQMVIGDYSDVCNAVAAIAETRMFFSEKLETADGANYKNIEVVVWQLGHGEGVIVLQPEVWVAGEQAPKMGRVKVSAFDLSLAASQLADHILERL